MVEHILGAGSYNQSCKDGGLIDFCESAIVKVSIEDDSKNHLGNSQHSRWVKGIKLFSVVGTACMISLLLLGMLGFESQNRETVSSESNGVRGWDIRSLQAGESCAALSCQSVSYCSCVKPVAEKSVGFVVLEWALIVLLICMSALFSGLTLGLMSLDKIGLEIVIGGDPESSEAKYARKIQPVREKGNLLLCTLLLGNVMANAALSIFLADYTSGPVGFILSTALIVIFGEIFPQAACSRYALWVGAHTIYIVKFFLVVLYVLAKPLSLVLDLVFKEEIGAIYSSKQLGKLVQIHHMHEQLDEDQAKMMGGALDYSSKVVKDVMTPADKIFMLPVDQVLDFTTMTKIFRAGYSRIPVCEENDPNKIVGLLFTKDLILIDPEDSTSVKSVVQFFGRPVQFLWPDTTLSDALALFKSGSAHLALIRNVNNDSDDRDPFYEVCGLVTLEDIIEEILQDEIHDETDHLITHQKFVGSVDRSAFDFARLRLLDSHHKNNLSEDEINAIVAHLAANSRAFEVALTNNRISREEIRLLIKSCSVMELELHDTLYMRGKPAAYCTLILNGKVRVISGEEEFRSSLGAWSLLGQGALDKKNPDGEYTSDFSAKVTSEDGVRCIYISRTSFDQMCTRHEEKIQLAASSVTSSISEEPQQSSPSESDEDVVSKGGAKIRPSTSSPPSQ